MLSSVAQRFYWTGRYLERAENTARLLNVYTQLLLDLPPQAGVTMRHLVRISGSEALFDAKRRWPLETSVVRFMTVDEENSGCILSSLASARENLRTLRDIVPSEGFRSANELYLSADKKLTRTAIRRLRFSVLQEMIERCQQLSGLFAGTMSHGEGYSFLRLGRNLERADMTTRIIDVAGELLADSDADELAAHETILWVNVLRSLSAYQAYRQSVRSRIAPVRVLHFLIYDVQFPRTLAHCLQEVAIAADTLPRSERARAAVADMQEMIDSVGIRELASAALHKNIDRFQVGLAQIHTAIDQTWFRHERILADATPDATANTVEAATMEQTQRQ
jgi:uncharacterized alpha-E superfamily protein